MPAGVVTALVRDDPHARACLRDRFDDQPEKLRAQLRGELIDLNGDSKPEIRVSAETIGCFCGNAEGSCEEWIFRSTDRGYEYIGGYGKPQQTRTNGYQDLLHEGQISPTQRMRVLYRFDGSRYAVVECSEQNTRHGPEFTRVACPNSGMEPRTDPVGARSPPPSPAASPN